MNTCLAAVRRRSTLANMQFSDSVLKYDEAHSLPIGEAKGPHASGQAEINTIHIGAFLRDSVGMNTVRFSLLGLFATDCKNRTWRETCHQGRQPKRDHAVVLSDGAELLDGRR
jgi:hypothetical protein